MPFLSTGHRDDSERPHPEASRRFDESSTSIKTVTIPPGSVGLTIHASEYQNAAANGTSCDDPGLRTP